MGAKKRLIMSILVKYSTCIIIIVCPFLFCIQACAKILRLFLVHAVQILHRSFVVVVVVPRRYLQPIRNSTFNS